MKHAKHQKRLTSKSKSKLVIMIVAFSVLLLVTAGGVLAYLAVSTDPIPNTFVSTEVSCELTAEGTEGKTYSNIQVTNTGSIDGFVRVRLVATWVDEDGAIQGIPAWTPNVTINTTDWVKHTDGFYYYRRALAPDVTTPNMLTADIQLNGTLYDDYADNGFVQKLDIYTEIIQSNPTTAVQEAWKVIPTELP